MTGHGSKFKESIVWEFVRTAYSQGIHFVLTMVLARLLSPTEFGLVAMAYVVLRIAQVFSDVGFSSALIQKDKVTDHTYSTVFWINFVMGILFFVLIQILAQPIATFYKQEEIEMIVRVLGLIFLLDALSQVQATILKKDLNFKIINRIVIVSETLSGAVAVMLALLDWGVWSLVMQTLIFALLNLLMYWYFSAWRPSFKFNAWEARKLFSFGAFVFLSQLIGRISLRLDSLLIGRYFSPATLGYYNRADSLLGLVKKYSSSSLVKVAFPYFSLLKHDQEKFASKYTDLIAIIYFVIFLLSGFLFFAGEQLILMVYGSQWATAGKYFSVLAFTIFFYPVNAIMNNILLSKGFSKVTFNISLFSMTVRIIASVATLLYFNSMLHFLYAQVIISVGINILYMWCLEKYAKLHLGTQATQFLLYSGISLAAGFFAFFTGGLADSFGVIIQALTSSALYCLVFLMLNFMVNFTVLKNIYSQFKSLIPK